MPDGTPCIPAKPASVTGGGFIVCWRNAEAPSLRSLPEPVEFPTLQAAYTRAAETAARYPGCHFEVYQLVAVAPARGHEPKEMARA